MRRFVCIFLFVGACATSQSQTAATPGSAKATLADTTALATVDGLPIFAKDLAAEFFIRLEEIDDDAAQKKFQTTWILVEDAVTARLLAEEARRNNVTVEELKTKEIESKVKEPTAEEVRQMYDQNKDAIGVSFEIAEAPIKMQMRREKYRETERTYLDQLRDRAEVRYVIPPPRLRRVSVEDGGGAVWGPNNAPVTLVVYSDFQCPYCNRASHILSRLRELYPENLKIVFRHYPLPQHSDARAAAEAAECAAMQEKFWPYHDLLFSHLEDLSGVSLEKYAGEAQLDLAAFRACVAAKTSKEAVDEQIESGKKLEIQGTPALFLNGARIKGILPVPLMQSLIEAELSKK